MDTGCKYISTVHKKQQDRARCLQVICGDRLCCFGHVTQLRSAEDHFHAISAALKICPNQEWKHPPGRPSHLVEDLLCCTLASTDDDEAILVLLDLTFAVFKDLDLYLNVYTAMFAHILNY